MRYRIIAGALAALALTGHALPSESQAEIFRYLAPDGSVHYSNVPVEVGYRPYTIRSDVGFSTLRSASKRETPATRAPEAKVAAPVASGRGRVATRMIVMMTSTRSGSGVHVAGVLELRRAVSTELCDR